MQRGMEKDGRRAAQQLRFWCLRSKVEAAKLGDSHLGT